MAGLLLAKGLALPRTAVTQTFGFLARRGAGKTYAATKLFELLVGAGAPCIALDPVGNWYGLRLARNGKSPGLQVPVFGGLHGDLEIAPDSGGAVARMLLEHHYSAVLDVSGFRKGQRKRFVTDFAEELFEGAKRDKRARHVFIEEAQLFAPERGGRGDERMLGAIQDIVRLGRNYGLGATLVSQRPQSVSKEVLNQVECLCVGQLSGSHERKAIEAWTVANADAERLDTTTLPSLAVGSFWVYSPQWLKLCRRVHIARKRTYDASATPELGEELPAPAQLKRLDGGLLVEQFLDASKSSRSDAAPPARAVSPRTSSDTRTAEELAAAHRRVAELKEGIARLEPLLQAVNDRHLAVLAATARMGTAIEELFAAVAPSSSRPPAVPVSLRYRDDIPEVGGQDAGIESNQTLPPHRLRAPVFPATSPAGVSDTPDKCPAGGMRRILIALTQADPSGLDTRRLGIRARLRRKAGTFTTYLGKLRRFGWVEGGADRLLITEAGRSALGPFEPLPTYGDLREQYLAELGDTGAARMLRTLAEVYPEGLQPDELRQRVGLANAGTFTTYLGTLRRRELVEPGKPIRLNPELAGPVGDGTLISDWSDPVARAERP